MEALRRSRGIDRWIVSGSSWGVALTLAYLCQHPDRVLGVLLRGITTCGAAELDWVYRDGASRLLPEAWEAFASLESDPTADLVASYRRALDDEERREAAALAWCRWELAGMRAAAGSEVEAILTEPRFARCSARISTHYAAHRGFIDHERLWSLVPGFGHIPATMIQGPGLDLCTPPDTAWQLHRQWPGSRRSTSWRRRAIGSREPPRQCERRWTRWRRDRAEEQDVLRAPVVPSRPKQERVLVLPCPTMTGEVHVPGCSRRRP